MCVLLPHDLQLEHKILNGVLFLTAHFGPNLAQCCNEFLVARLPALTCMQNRKWEAEQCVMVHVLMPAGAKPGAQPTCSRR